MCRTRWNEMIPLLCMFLSFVSKSHEAPYPKCCPDTTTFIHLVGSISSTIGETTQQGYDAIREAKLLSLELRDTVILAAERNSFKVAGVLMLITMVILLVGTCIVSCCSRDHVIDYSSLPQAEWLPEHVDFDSFIDLIHNIHKYDKLKLQEHLRDQGIVSNEAGS